MRPHPRRASRLALIFVILLLMGGMAALSTNVIFSDHPAFHWNNATLLGTLRTLLRSSDRPLAGEKDDRVNILILGMGGEGHDGPYLTDTIIVASYQPSTDRLALLSIPRDLDVDAPGYGNVKVNAVNAYAEQKKRGSGAEETARVLSSVLDERIDYWVRLDFRGFAKAIDAVGGVDVTVDRGFTDPTYPTDDDAGTVQTETFSAGRQHMNGQTALIFARSRHGNNGEGSDFARSKRQEKILMALRDKLRNTGTLLNPFTVSGLFGAVRDNVQTNLATWEIMRLAQQAGDVKPDEVALRVMSDANILNAATGIDGAFLLLPRGNDWKLVSDFARNVFIDAAQPKPEVVKIEIQNGTSVTGLGNSTATRLSANGFTVTGVGNADRRDFDRSVIYDFTGGKKTDALVRIRTLVDANVATSLPPGLKNANGADFIVILGKNASL